MFDDDDYDPLNETHWTIEQFNLWHPDSQSPFINIVTHLALQNEVIELPKLETLLTRLNNLRDLTLIGLMDQNGDEIPVMDILNLINSIMPQRLQHLRRFQCNNRIYIPDNTPNINFNSEQAKHSGLRPLSHIKKDIDAKNAQNKHKKERDKLHALSTLNVVFDKKEREQPDSITLPPELRHLITTFNHEDIQPSSNIDRREQNYNRILENTQNRGGRRRTRRTKKSRKSRKRNSSKRRK